MNKFKTVKEILIQTKFSDSTIRRWLKHLTETERKAYTKQQGNRILIDLEYFKEKQARVKIGQGTDVINYDDDKKNLLSKLIQDQDKRIANLEKQNENLFNAMTEKDKALNEKDDTIKILLNRIIAAENEIKQLSSKANVSRSTDDNKFFLIMGLIALSLVLICIYILL
jgi:hypothetical protein